MSLIERGEIAIWLLFNKQGRKGFNFILVIIHLRV